MRPGLLLALVLATAPAFAQVRHAAIYPLAGDGVSRSECADIESTLRSALLRTSRSGPFAPAATPVLPSNCGPAAKPDLACLSRAAGTGVVLFGTVKRSGIYLQTALWAVDARGRAAGPVRVTIDPAFDNPRAFNTALEQLDAGAAAPKPAPPPPVASGSAMPPAVNASPPAAAAVESPMQGAPPAAAATPAPAAQTAPAQPPPAADPAPRPRVPAAALSFDEPAPSGRWLKPAALGTGIGAVAALAGALVFGHLAQKSNDDLAARYATHALTTGDASTYQQIDRNSNLANELFIASGVLAATALTFWALVPDEDDTGRGYSRRY